jgi:hypothetical protein
MPKNKHKKALHLDLDLARVSSNLGFVAMSAAAVLSLVEIEHLKQERLAALVPAFESANVAPTEHSNGEELFRRGEREESPHSMVSYGTTMRSHATAGKL